MGADWRVGRQAVRLYQSRVWGPTTDHLHQHTAGGYGTKRCTGTRRSASRRASGTATSTTGRAIEPRGQDSATKRMPAGVWWAK